MQHVTFSIWHLTFEIWHWKYTTWSWMILEQSFSVMDSMVICNPRNLVKNIDLRDGSASKNQIDFHWKPFRGPVVSQFWHPVFLYLLIHANVSSAVMVFPCGITAFILSGLYNTLHLSFRWFWRCLKKGTFRNQWQSFMNSLFPFDWFINLQVIDDVICRQPKLVSWWGEW